ncbi:MAG TPA: extracellular solute-binding protein [Tepidisphaeraceae bacterium]|nr:extracellular solute-binding protein [Tepidisphaeraceae bacterium]
MRRYVLLILFAAVLGLPYVMKLAVGGRSAKKQSIRAGVERLVIVTPHVGDIRREFESAFTRWYVARYGAEVELDFRVPGGSNDIKRMLDNIYRGYRQADGTLPGNVPVDLHVVWGGGDYFLDQELKPLGILQPLKLDPKLLEQVFPQPTLAGVKLYDSSKDPRGQPAPQWVGVCLSSFGIVYNPDLYRTLHLPEPRQWQDLTHERLAGLVALADPSHSASAALAYMMVLQRAMADAEEAFFAENPALKTLPRAELAKNANYQRAIGRGWKQGMKTLLLIAANARYFTNVSSFVPNDVGNGQAAAGMAIDFYGRVYQESVGADRCKFIAPAAATAITPDPVAVLYGVKGPQEELANRFVEFLLSPEGQRLWILKAGEPGGPRERSLRRLPVRQDVYRDRRGWTDDVNPFAEAGGFNQRAEWMGTYGEMRAIWLAAWIDSREALRDAYGKVLQVNDPQKRAELIDNLADLPITMEDVAALRIKRKEAEAAHKGDEWKAGNRIHWAQTFERHYQRVAKAAEAAR